MPVAAGILPFIPSIVGGVGGLLQTAFAGKRRKERELEQQAAMQPKYGGSPALDQYYQQALQQANTAAQQSALYKQQQQQIGRNLATGLSATGFRPGGQGMVSGLVQGATDASMRNLAQAEGQKERRFGVLGQVTQAKSAEDLRKFQMNQLQPWQTKFNMLAQRAAQAAQQQQSGLSNLASAAANAGRVAVAGLDSGLSKVKAEKPFTPKELMESGALSTMSSGSFKTSKQLVPDQITDFNMPEGQYEPNLYSILSRRRKNWSM